MKKIRKYLNTIPIDLKNVDEKFDVIVLTNDLFQKELIKYFENQFGDRGKIAFPKTDVIVKLNDESDDSLLYLLVRKIKKSSMYQIDIYYKNLYPYVSNSPISTIVIENSMKRDIALDFSYFDYQLAFEAEKMDEIEVKNTFQIHYIIAKLIVSLFYVIGSKRAEEYYGFFPKNEILFDGKTIKTEKGEHITVTFEE